MQHSLRSQGLLFFRFLLEQTRQTLKNKTPATPCIICICGETGLRDIEILPTAPNKKPLISLYSVCCCLSLLREVVTKLVTVMKPEFQVTYFLWKARKDKDGLAPVYIRSKQNSEKQSAYNTGVKIHPAQWNRKRREPKNKPANLLEL